MVDNKSRDSQDELEMRPVKIADSQQLLEWRNHKRIRQYSKHSQEITLDVHNAWLTKKLDPSNHGSKIWIFSEGGKDIGMTRLDILDGTFAEISILVEPTLHHKGLGSRILQQTIKYAFEGLNYSGLRADIHIENRSSAALFLKFGFARVKSVGLFETYLLLKSN